MHGRQRHDSFMGVPQVQSRLLRLHRPRLEQENGGDDLQAVCDAVLHLLDQHLLLSQQLVLLKLGISPLGYVLDRQEQGRVRHG